MEISPLELYRQAVNKQRIMIVGDNRKSTGNIIVHVLKYHHRKFDYVADLQGHASLSDAPILIAEGEEKDVKDFQHHILILTPKVNSVSTLCDLTPKSGLIIYPDGDSQLKDAASKDRPDVVSIGYKVYKHEKKGAAISLVSSTNERFPVKFTTDAQLTAAAAAKEVLKKIGITSGQFYEAIQSFE